MHQLDLFRSVNQLMSEVKWG